MANKIALSIIISIILTIILVSTVNVGLSLFLERPDYNDHCDLRPAKLGETQVACEAQDGEWVVAERECPEGADCPTPDGYCDTSAAYEECNDEYQDALKPYNQIRFYVFAIIGFALLLVGLFTKENLIQLTGLATGGILVFQGIVTNLENKAVVFISLLLILAVFGVLAYRVINKK